MTKEKNYSKKELRNLEKFNRLIIGGVSFKEFISGLSLPKGSKPISYRDAVDAYRSNIEFNFAKLQGIKTVPKNRKQVRGVFNDAYYNYFLRKRDPMEKYKVYSPVKKLTDKIIDSMKDGHILE